VGPAAAGAMIALLPREQVGMAIAFAFDAFTFAVSVATLWMMKTGGETSASAAGSDGAAGILRSIREGVAFMFSDPALRAMFILIAVANLAFGGPVIVWIPYLAATRFTGGAAAYGLIISGYAGGNLLGIILCGALPKISNKAVKVLLVGMFAAFGLGTGALAWIQLTGAAFADLFILGILNGYLAILLITGLQRNTPKEMLGRLMSMMLLANLIFIPLSQIGAGGLLRWSTPALFLAAAGMLLVCAIYLALPGVGELLAHRFLDTPGGSTAAELPGT
jgi:hypothetical protein